MLGFCFCTSTNLNRIVCSGDVGVTGTGGLVVVLIRLTIRRSHVISDFSQYFGLPGGGPIVQDVSLIQNLHETVQEHYLCVGLVHTHQGEPEGENLLIPSPTSIKSSRNIWRT